MLPYLQYPRVSALPGGPRLALGTCQPEHSGPLREVPGAFWKRTTPTPNSSGGGWAAPSTPARVVLAWDPQELHPGRVPFLLPPSALCQHGHPCSWLLLWVWGGGLLSGSRSSPCPHAQHLCCLHNQFSGCPPRAKHVGSSSSPKRRQVEGALESESEKQRDESAAPSETWKVTNAPQDVLFLNHGWVVRQTFFFFFLFLLPHLFNRSTYTSRKQLSGCQNIFAASL